MTNGDFLNFISLTIAAYSLLYSKDGQIFIYKFPYWYPPVAIAMTLVALLLINFDLLYANGIYVEAFIYNSPKAPPAPTWAFFLVIITTCASIYICFFTKKISKYRKNDLYIFYERLLFANPQKLIDYIRTYSLDEINREITFYNRAFHNNENEDFKLAFEEPQEAAPKPPQKRNIVLITLRKEFIDQSIKYGDVTFFLSFIHNLECIDLPEAKEAILYYYKSLLESKNKVLYDSLRETYNITYDKISYYTSKFDFTKYTFRNIYFVCNFEIWRVFGECGIMDAKYNDLFSSECIDFRQEEYANSPAYICLRFYDILIKELAQKNCNKPIYEYYLYLICESAFSNIDNSDSVAVRENSYAQLLKDDTLRTLRSIKEYLRLHPYGGSTFYKKIETLEEEIEPLK